MNIRNCSRCGKIYTYDGFRVCRNCRLQDEKDFDMIKKYLREVPGAGIAEVESATGIESKKIIEFLKEGRLELINASGLFLQCERCGENIRSGRFCDRCTNEMENALNASLGSKSEKTFGSALPKKKEEKIGVLDRKNRRGNF